MDRSSETVRIVTAKYGQRPREFAAHALAKGIDPDSDLAVLWRIVADEPGVALSFHRMLGDLDPPPTWDQIDEAGLFIAAELDYGMTFVDRFPERAAAARARTREILHAQADGQ